MKNMESKANLNNVHIILVEPKEPGNIGSCCRAMKNMGITKLRLVNPVPYLVPETFRLCYGADDLILNSEVYPDLKSAVADLGFVVGTTRRHGKFRKVEWISDVVPDIINYSQDNKVAVVFGREAKGLFNDELSLCQAQAAIPTKTDFPTLNLAQAVLVVCYELFLSRHKSDNPPKKLVSQDELDRMYDHIKEALFLLGYGFSGSRDLRRRIIDEIKEIANKIGLENRDIQMVHGLCSQIEIKLKEK